MIDPSILHNSFFSGGIALGALGAAGMWLRSVWGNTQSFISRRFITTVEIREDDPSFEYVENWLHTHPYSERNRMIGVRTLDGDDALTAKKRFILTPSPGVHFFVNEGKLFWIDKNRQKMENGFGKYGSEKAYNDTLYIKILFADKKYVFNFLNNCYEQFKKEKKSTINVYYYMDGWNVCRSKDINVPNYLITTEDQRSIVTDCQRFIKSKEWYDSMGIPWHRGYLLYGEPGCGKSATLIEVAKELKHDIYFLNLSDSKMDDNTLIERLAYIDYGAMIVIEEIDTVFLDRKDKSDDDKGRNLSLGGLLNILDGIVAKDGRMIFMTTNC